MSNIENDRLLKVLRGEPVDRTPVWIMRQAGRYLPEYREIRAKAGSFMALCQNPELAAQVTLQPLTRFPLDAVIMFADILLVPDAMGMGLHFAAGEGPKFTQKLRTHAEVEKLPQADVEKSLGYVYENIRCIKSGLNNRVPLIGFAGSPWTVATYMLEGQGSKTFSQARRMVYQQPKTLSLLLDKLVQSTIDYLQCQIDAGIDAFMLFDTWGGLLSHDQYEQVSLRPMAKIIEALKKNNIPSTIFTKGGGAWLQSMKDVGANAVGLDWTMSLAAAKKIVGQDVALQGNLDPSVLYAEPAVIRQKVAEVLASYGQGHRHIFNLGHGIYPDVPPEHLGACIAAVHELSPQYH